MTTKKTNNRPPAASDAFDTQVGDIEANILTYFQPTQPLPLGPTPETAQAFKAELVAYQKLCDDVTNAETATTNAKAAKKAAADLLRPKVKSLHLVTLAAYEDNPEVVVKMGFHAPKSRVKATGAEKITTLQKKQAKTAARKANKAALAATLAAIDAGVMTASSTPEASPAASSAASVTTVKSS